MSCVAALTEAVFFRIKGGNVLIETGSGYEPINLSMPIAEFRKAIAGGQAALDAFDAEHRVLMLRG